MTGVPAGTFRQVAAGTQHACGVRSDGTIACWGRSDVGQTDPPADLFLQVSAGRHFTCGALSNGLVKCWGLDNLGQAPEPRLAPTALPGGVVGLTYLQGMNLLADSYTPVVPEFHLTAGAAPGLSLTSVGILSGLPTAAGSFPLTVSGEDENGFFAIKATPWPSPAGTQRHPSSRPP